MANSSVRISPKDIFMQAVNRLYSYLEPYGFSLLKNGDIKKKSIKFTAKIFFFRSCHNYISKDQNGYGSVRTEIYATINIKNNEEVYRVKFGKGSSTSKSYELLGKNDALDAEVVDEIWRILSAQFVEVIEGLEMAPYEQLFKMGLVPEISPDDYEFTCYIKRPLLEVFGYTDLLDIYDKNCAIFNSPDVSARRCQDNYFETLRERVDFEYSKTLTQEYLLELLEEANQFLKTTDRYNSRITAEYHLCYTRKEEDWSRFVLAVFQFLYPNTYVWFKNETAIEALNQKTLALYEKLLKRTK